ncbi:MAG: hypothetical protein U9R32_10330, partial [Bacteroidota bacterium]|nr:hypothetical protein [Bacteroidota bacterium]
AMNYTLRHPDKVKKLIVIDISMRKYPVLSQQIEVIDTMLKIDASGIESYRELRRVIAEVVKSERQQQLVLKNLKKDGKNGFVWKIAIESLRRNMSNIYEAVEKNGVFEKEALFVSGGRSGYITDEDINEIKLFFTEALVEIIPEASHWVHVDAPDKLLKLVKEFVTY